MDEDVVGAEVLDLREGVVNLESACGRGLLIHPDATFHENVVCCSVVETYELVGGHPDCVVHHDVVLPAIQKEAPGVEVTCGDDVIVGEENDE